MASIKELIAIAHQHGLVKKSRKRDIVYKRQYMFSELRKSLTFEQIAHIFEMNHSTVIYGISQHDLFMKQNDMIYMKVISEIYQEVNRFSIDALSSKNLYMDVISTSGPIVTLEIQLTSTDPEWFLNNKGILSREIFRESL
jgi:hypothetical protein